MREGEERGARRRRGKARKWRDLPTPEDIATEIWPLVRSMIDVRKVRDYDLIIMAVIV